MKLFKRGFVPHHPLKTVVSVRCERLGRKIVSPLHRNLRSGAGFTLLELIISVGLFFVAITVALVATVGTTGLITRTEARSVVAEGGRTINDTLRRTIDNAPLNAVETLKATPGSPDNVGVRVKTFATDQTQKVCNVIGRATATDAGGEEIYNLDETGKTVALWVYPLSDTNLCPDLTSAVLYQNRLVDNSATVTTVQFALLDNTCPSGCTQTQQLRYRFQIQTTQAQSGQASETRRPSVDVISSLPVGLVTLPAAGSGSNSGLQITTSSPLPSGEVGTAYSTTLQAINGQTPYAWLIAAGSLPSGLSLGLLSGIISGTPARGSNGVANFTVRVIDSSLTTADKPFALTVNSSPGGLNITTTTLPDGRVGVAYSQTLQATGGQTPYVWSIISGSLPAGLSLSSAGVISGTPTTAGSSVSFTVQARDSGRGQSQQTDTQLLSITITPGGGLDP